MSATAVPTVEDMFRVWGADRCVQDASARNYIRWIKWFRFYAAQRGLDERAELTVEGARRFALWYVQYRHINLTRLDKARPALHALSRVYRMIGLNPPTWHVPRPPSPPASALLQEYADHLARHRGNPAVTVQKRLDHVGRLLEHLAGNGKTWRTMALTDIDDFLMECAQRFARSSVADLAGSILRLAGFCSSRGAFRSLWPIP
jgi:integrase/recombinase XerD